MVITKSEHKKQISFYVNGKLHTVKDEFPLTTSLNYYLRSVLLLTGTKVYCNEGGCGCCVVNAKELDKTTNEYKDISINSCLFPLYSCDGYSFTTVEGIGNKKIGLHPIQKKLADKNGSQCGYCSPGFVMSMYSKLKSNSKLTKEEIEKSFDGNICRCTGYRSILEAMKSFAYDQQPIDIEDLSKNLKCLDTNNQCCVSDESMLYLTKDNKMWYSPQNLEDLKTILNENQNIKFRYVCGNTSTGIYKNQGPSDAYINIKNVKELYQISKADNCLTLGSNLTLSKLMEVFEDVSSTKNFAHLAQIGKNFERVANVHVRNIACWAGNLAIKKEHREFPSDVLVILESAGAKLNLFRTDLNMNKKMSLNEFLNDSDLKNNNYLIESLELPSFDQDKIEAKYYKVSPRSRNAHAYINCGFRFEFESLNSTQLSARPLIVFNGIHENFYHASKLEDYLDKKDLSNKETILKSIEILSSELNSSGIHEINDPLLSSSKYRVSLALSLLYKFLLSINLKKSKQIKTELKSTIETITDCRSVTSTENKFEAKSDLYPLTKPSPKLNAYSQTSGETKYVDDLAPLAHQTHAAFIVSTVANAKIESIDTSLAEKVPGVIQIFLAKDIPGENTVMPKPFGVEPVFAETEVLYCGQPIGLVVAETREIAKKASKMVKVNYFDFKKPILNIQDALKENSFHQKPSCGDLTKGDPDTAINNSKHQISGEFLFDISQYHFFLEGLIANCEPTEDGYKIECTTQWIDSVQRSVATVLGLENSSCVDVQVKQLGGGFGGKITRGNIPSTAAALAAYHLRRPVKVHMDLNDCMEIIGNRPTWFVKYKAGFEDDGKINGIHLEWFTDSGFSPNGSYVFFGIHFFENVYNFPNIHLKTANLKTNKPAATEVRSPDVTPAISATEQVLEHIANYLNKDSLQVREINFFKKGDKTAYGHLLSSIDVEKVVDELKQSSEFYKRKQEVDEFNRINKFKKRGIALIPLRYGMTYNFGFYNAIVSVKHHDGSVSVSHGGIEMGQGIHTKVAQACAYELGIPLEKVSIKSTNNLVNPNCLWTGASVTSELCCASVIGACKALKEKLEPVRKIMTENYTWPELISKAFSMNIDLTATYFQRPQDNLTDLMTYDLDASACTEVLIDVLTGETQILRTDILYDCGQSVNGLIDIGQAEGGFVMGLGFMLLEKLIFDPESGKCLNNGTWEYKPPLATDIPIDFRIKFLENKPNPLGVLGSKAIGEPPLILSNSILYAIRYAILSARQDRGITGHFRLDLPATVESIQQACLVNSIDYEI